MKKILPAILGLSLIISLSISNTASQLPTHIKTEDNKIPSVSSSISPVWETIPAGTLQNVVTKSKIGDNKNTSPIAKTKQKPKLKQKSKPKPKPKPKRPPVSKVTQTHTKKDNSMYRIQIVVGDQTFPTVLYKNKTTDALMDRLPMTLKMGDLNGNEKYFYFPDSLPTNTKKPSKIHTGDLMLYGTDCLVLFYESFSSSYSYTPLGYVEDVAGFTRALGNGTIQVTFK